MSPRARFSANLLAAVAKHLDVDPDDLLEASRSQGRPRCHATRDAFVALARRTFPTHAQPTKKLARLMRGEAEPRPVFDDLATLEDALGITAADLFRGPR